MALPAGLSLLMLEPARAVVLLHVQQVSGDVLITGSGSADTTDLTAEGTDTSWTNLLSDTQAYAGPDAFSDGSVSLWSGISGPLAFGSDPTVVQIPTSGTGQLFGILADNGSRASRLVLPLGYSSGASLSGTSSFTGLTLARLGLTPGQISTWSWGQGATADSLRLEVRDNDPVPAPLPIAGAAAAFSSSQRLRRRMRRRLI